MLPDLRDVIGLPGPKRALEVAAAGNHHLLMAGPPGTGKTLLASRLPGILPPMTERESLEAAALASISQAGLDHHKWGIRPFRTPHHSCSGVALAGGGSRPRPGEISLAHNGVLFLDELPEFGRHTLEILREPIESGRIVISRATRQATFPARFQLITAMNPCPCGYYNHPSHECSCLPGKVPQYLNRVSGPLMDRIDIHIEVVPVPFGELSDMQAGEKSEIVRKRVIEARNIQEQRYKEEENVHCNAQMPTRLLMTHCDPGKQGQVLLKGAMEKLSLSARAYDRILKVARTIADLDGKEKIMTEHLAEAINYRSLDRESWGK